MRSNEADEDSQQYQHITRNNKWRGHVTMVVAVVSSGLVTTGIFTVHGFPSLSLPQLTTPNTTSIYLLPHQASWFATVSLLMGVPGSVVGGALCEWVGPRRLQLVISPLLCLTFLALHLASWPSVQDLLPSWPLLMAIRVVQGLLAALLNASSMVLPCEVSDISRRGSLASLLEVWVTLGFLLCYLQSGLILWENAALLIPLLTLIPGCLGLLMVPESPPWLYRKHREAEALTSLLRLRKSREVAEKEMDEMKMTDQQNTKKVTWHQLLKLMKQKAYVTPMLISVFLASLKELCGLGVVAIYIIEIYAMTGVGHNQYWNSVVSGSVRLLFNFIASLLLSRMRRKVLLVTGSCLGLVAAASLGVFFCLKEHGYNISGLSWLPLVSIIIYVAGLSGGVLPAAWLAAAEVLPSKVRSIGMGITITIYTIMYFLVSKTYDDVKAIIGPHGIFWSYSLGCLAYVLFVIKFVPETRGMTANDTDSLWKKSCDVNLPLTQLTQL